MFDWLYNLLGTMLAWFTSWTGSYAIALLFYALIFKILFLPFSIKQQKNQIKMAKLTPKIQLIRAKYKGRTDQVTLRKQQEEIMALQQQEGYSMLSGCLPLLLQMPIIIFLYNVIRNPLSYIAKLSKDVIVALSNLVNGTTYTLDNFGSIDQILLVGKIKEYGAANGYGAIESITTVEGATTIINNAGTLPNFDLWGVNLALTPNFTSILILIPILAAAFQWFSMFIMKKFSGNSGQVAMDDNSEQSQMSLKIMDLVMPLMTLWLTFSFSAMMGLYWIYQSIFSIIQAVILGYAMPIPKYTEEEIKAMRKAQKAAEKAQKEIIKTQPKYKSLHYIDEDDYDELPTVNTKPTKPVSGAYENRPEIKD